MLWDDYSTCSSSLRLTVHANDLQCRYFRNLETREKSAWIEIRLEEGTGTVVRNDKFPDRMGRIILNDLQADKSKKGLWHGVIYVEKLGEYKDVKISLPEDDQMLIKGRVGFMSRTVEWMRVDEMPPH